MTSRVPPHDLNAENALLGALMLSSDAVNIVSETVLSSDFYSPANGAVFGAILSLAAQGVKPDVVTVARYLADNKISDYAGGAARLATVLTNTPTISSAPHYAQIVVEKATLRRMIAAATEIMDLAYSSPDDVSSAVETANLLLAEVGTAAIVAEPEDVSIEEFVDRPRELVTEWVLHALIRRRHKMLIVGGEGSGKSSIGRFVTICGAYGIQPWRHTRIKPIRALICDFENPEDALYESFVPILKQAQAHSGVDIEDVTNRLWWRPEGVNLRNRSDIAHLENVIRARRPDLVFMGPMYAMYDTDSKDFGWETAARQVTRGLKRLMVRYNFALIIEDHAPNDREGAMRPYGSSFWRRWVDLGVGLEPIPLPDDKKFFYEDRFIINHWRGQRVQTDWPRKIIRGDSIGSKWYFEGLWGNEDF